MLRTIVSLILLLMLSGLSTAQAQNRFTLELRGGADVATSDLGDATLKTGGGFEVNLGYWLFEYVGAYAGWDWQRRVTDQPFAGGDFDVEDTGYAFGIRLQYPIQRSVGVWVRGGGLYDHIELEDDTGAIVSDSGHELGWEAGGGLSLALGSRFALTPGVRYRSLSTDIDGGQGMVPVDLTYVTFEFGVAWGFGGTF